VAELHAFHQAQVQELQRKIIEQARVIEVQSSVVNTVGQQFQDLKESYIQEAFPQLFPQLPPLPQCPAAVLNLPCKSMELFIDDYMGYLQKHFLVNSLFLNVMATPVYKTLTCRVWMEKGYVGLKTLQDHGYLVNGQSSFTLCQYVADTGRRLCFSNNNLPPLWQALSSEQLMLWFQEEKPDVKQLFDEMKSRGLPSFPDFLDQEGLLEGKTAREINYANMLEVAIYRKLNYIGAPVKDSNGNTLAVLCLLHDYPSKSRNMWPELSQIEEVCDSLGKLLERELAKVQCLQEIAEPKATVEQESSDQIQPHETPVRVSVTSQSHRPSQRTSYAAAHLKLMETAQREYNEEIPVRWSRVSWSLRPEEIIE